jgi:hypothetical protein
MVAGKKLTYPYIAYVRPVPVKPDDVVSELSRQGFAVVQGVISTEHCAEYADSMWRELSHLTQGRLGRHDTTTYDEWAKLNVLHSMLCQNFGIGHLKTLWQMRLHPGVLNVFETIHGTRCLLTSFDGMALALPPEDRKGKGAFKGNLWLHTDQAPNKTDRLVVQSVLNLVEVREGDATTMFYTGSNQFHAEFFQEKLRRDEKTPTTDWYKIDAKSPWEGEFFKSRGCKLVAIALHQGDLLLWDSRTFHQGVEARAATKDPFKRSKSNYRLAGYFCFTPRSWATVKNIATRIANFKKASSSSHSPHAGKTFAKKPRMYPDQVLPPVNHIEPLDITRFQPSATKKLKELIGF